jgi:hypothetical protein
MRHWLTLLFVLWQAAPAFNQLRKNTFAVTPDGPTNFVLTVGSYYPLRDVLNYLNHEYGWRISYEDPVYPEAELFDIAIPEWKKAHPGERGFYAPKFMEIQFRISKPAGSQGEREKIIGQLIEQFNRSDRDEKFALVDASPERQIVVGTMNGQGVLDQTTVGPEVNPRNGSLEISSLTQTCSQQMPLPMIIGTVSANLMGSITVPRRKALTSCRDAILALTDQGGDGLIYMLNEDPTGRTFVLNIVPNRIVIAKPK